MRTIALAEIAPEFLLPDEGWEQVNSAIPPEPPKPKGERLEMADRQALNAIFYVMRTGYSWNALRRCSGTSRDLLQSSCQHPTQWQ